MYGYIYKTVNNINGKFYIGKHKYPKYEIDPSYYGSGKRLKEAIKKYGKENFSRELICICETSNIANDLEKFWIKKLDATNRLIGYNLSKGGDANVPYECLLEGAKKRKGRKHPEDVKRKMSESMKGKKFTKEHKDNLSKNHRLKTTHIKYFKDGSYELTDDSVKKIAETLNKSKSELRRASEVGEFRCGDFFLLDLMKPDHAFNHKFRYNKEKCFFDPIKKDIVSHNTLRIRHQHHMEEYAGVDLYNFTEEKLKEKNDFIKKYEDLKKKILGE